MSDVAVVPRASIVLRCHHCSHAVGTSYIPMQLAGIFKASRMGKVGRSHTAEVRKRCEACGWVNVFHPVSRTGEVIELK